MPLAKLSTKLHRSDSTLYYSFSPQRSGQHLVISWLCRGFDNILHINHVRSFRLGLSISQLPMAGRICLYHGDDVTDTGTRPPRTIPSLSNTNATYDKELWTTEDIAPQSFLYRDFGGAIPARVFLILRDPGNWMASTFRMGKWSQPDFERKLRVYEKSLQFYRDRKNDPLWSFISFNQFVADPTYRQALSDSLTGHNFDRAEPALGITPDFGGGSSFFGMQGSAGAGVEERWRDYKNNPNFRKLLSGRALRQNAEAFFGSDYLTFLD